MILNALHLGDDRYQLIDRERSPGSLQYVFQECAQGQLLHEASPFWEQGPRIYGFPAPACQLRFGDGIRPSSQAAEPFPSLIFAHREPAVLLQLIAQGIFQPPALRMFLSKVIRAGRVSLNRHVVAEISDDALTRVRFELAQFGDQKCANTLREI